MGNKLEAVAAEIDPEALPVTAGAAVRIAFEDGYDQEGAATVTPLLAVYTSSRKRVADGQEEDKAPTQLVYEDRLAWVLNFDGVCVPRTGPPYEGARRCAGTEINVVVDAHNGRIVEAYSYQ
jgi:hypothetical protein